MSAELVEASAADLDRDLVDRWRRLAEARENPFLSPEWNRAWHETETAERPFLLLWRRDGELRGVLPLALVRSGPLRLLRFAGARRGDWFTPACARADEVAMASDCAALLGRERARWHAVPLRPGRRRLGLAAALWADRRRADRAGAAAARGRAAIHRASASAATRATSPAAAATSAASSAAAAASSSASTASPSG